MSKCSFGKTFLSLLKDAFVFERNLYIYGTCLHPRYITALVDLFVKLFFYATELKPQAFDFLLNLFYINIFTFDFK